MSAHGVFTRRKRFTFVEKSASEVGDMKDHCMLVTPAQLEEIMYRVKDAWFTSGSIAAVAVNGDNTYPCSSIMAGGTPPDQLVTYADDDGYDYAMLRRGYYWRRDGIGDMHADDAAYFGDEYIVRYYKYRDVGDNEMAIFLPDRATAPVGFNGETLVTGFNHFFACEAYAGNNHYAYALIPPPSLLVNGSLSVSIGIFPDVAWVDDNNSGNPLDPLNRLYLKIKAEADGSYYYGYAPYFLQYWLYTAAGQRAPGPPVSSMEYITDLAFDLADSTCSCKLYGAIISGTGYFSSGYSSPLTITAKKWWPYAKAGGPVWNTETGAPL